MNSTLIITKITRLAINHYFSHI